MACFGLKANMEARRLVLTILSCVIILLTLTMAVFFDITSYGFHRLRHADYGKVSVIRTNVSNMFDNQTTPESRGEEKMSHRLSDETEKPQMKLSDPQSACYRQIQRWRGSTTPQKPLVVAECPGLDCGIRMIEDRSFETMMKSHVLIHYYHFKKWDWAEMQRKRPPHQAWMFYSMESTELPNKVYEDLYNYTMTYRSSSTFPRPYGYYNSGRPQVPHDNNRNWALGRNKMAVWAASNCRVRWGRMEFVKELAKHIQVDIFGKCGQPGCDKNSKSCWNLLRTYKFYLALENRECKDYITEKFWRTSLKYDLLPIVYGAPKEDYERVAPPHSFIHLQDFSSMEELVDYLNLLDSNDTLYNSYFEWKRHGSVGARRDYFTKYQTKYFCQVVAKVLDYEKGLSSTKIKEGANSTVFNSWRHEECRIDIAPGFPHGF